MSFDYITWRNNRRHIAQQHVDALRAKTFCAICGGQPVEYHNPSHPDNPHQRISWMTSHGRSIPDIDAEIACCIPLCSKCHWNIDRVKQRGPCKNCGRAIKLEAFNFCKVCYDRRKYAKKKAWNNVLTAKTYEERALTMKIYLEVVADLINLPGVV